MSFEPEWLYLDELLDLLNLTPDSSTVKSVVEPTLYRALDEGALQDRDGTPARVWHDRFEAGDPVIAWKSRTMIVPWWDRGWREWTPKPIKPQFPRAACLSIFSDLVPAAMRQAPTQSAKGRRAATKHPAKRAAARVPQKTIEELELVVCQSL